MYVGVYFRRNRNRHVKIMLTSIVWDFILILQIELARKAIMKAADAALHPSLLLVHLFFAVGSVVLYIFMLRSGYQILKGNTDKRSFHKKMGFITLFFRTMTLFTSIYVIK